jgi:hypothetical protein
LIFDSRNTTGGDTDLGTPNQSFGGPGVGRGGEVGQPYENPVALGNVLIVAEDLNGVLDDSADRDAFLELDFSLVGDGEVTVLGLTVMDIEKKQSPKAALAFFNAFGGMVAEFGLPPTGNNGVAVMDFGGVPVPDVQRIRVALNGSAAIDNVIFNPCE